MKRKISFFLFCLTLQFANAQERSITGKVLRLNDGTPIAGATVRIEGASAGSQTDDEGSFTIQAASGATIVITSIGYEEYRLQVAEASSYTVSLTDAATDLGEVVVTALGISREKRSLGYASQAIDGAETSTINSGNITNALSGRVSGVQIKNSQNMGGSTNVVIRGSKSLTGDNQALWVVDGVPISNANYNESGQQRAGQGYDYGNLASDINPDDIESINVLKGAAATALYGSRAANGAVVVTTKKGAKGGRVDINVHSNLTFGTIDKSTFPVYQTEYGSGYGKNYGPGSDGYFLETDLDGDGVDDLIVPLTEDASFGGPFDPQLMVFHWNALDPESPYYMQKRPWVAAENGPITFFETPLTNTNSVAVSGNMERGSYRFSYTNFNQKGLMPNSNLKRNNFSMTGSYKLFDKLTVSGAANYARSGTVGRNNTGYSSNSNIVTGFRAWWPVNVDIQELKDAYMNTKRNVSWNPRSVNDPKPIFWDNPYWSRYENYQTDGRSRFFGNMALQYDLTDWLNIYGRAAIDTYGYLMEERINNTSNRPGQYIRKNIDFTELNYDLMLNYNKDIADKFNLSGVLGTNLRRTNFSSIRASTNGGLIVDRLFSLSNSLNLMDAPTEAVEEIGVIGVYGLVSLGYDNLIYLDLTGRNDFSSTLPLHNRSFFYPSASVSFVFSELMESNVLSFGKLRLNYAQVGNSAPANSLVDVLEKPTPFGSRQIYSVNGTKRNPELKPENTESIEAGLEAYFLDRRVGADMSFYRTNTKNQIVPVTISAATGYTSKYVNSGEIQNQGVELSLFGTPLRGETFEWNIAVNWAMNRNKVRSLYEGVDNLLLASFQGGVTLNARVGQPYGTLQGVDFVYLNGQPVIDQSTGNYMRTSNSDNVIGNMNPDWNGGITNKFRYKQFDLSFLIDIQKGGDLFSLDLYSAYQSGAYENTVGLNDLGNPIRNTLEEGGGIVLDGVDPDGNPNQKRARMDFYANPLGYGIVPHAYHIYDASYVKLREVSLSYRLPASIFNNSPIRGIAVSAVGSNLWIIHKNLPYADPEGGLSAGNLQGFQVGNLPTTRNFGFSVNVQF